MNKTRLRLAAVIILVLFMLLLVSACGDDAAELEVVFDCNRGENDTLTFRVNDPSELILPPDPLWEHYTFGGWYWDEGVWKEPLTLQQLHTLSLSEDMTVKIYAKWEARSYKVTLDCTDADETLDAVTVRYGSDYRLPVPKKISERFGGWRYGDTLVTDDKGNSLTPFSFTEDITLTPFWVPDRVTLTLDSGVGEPVTLSVWLGEKVGTLPEPTKNDYLFVGWFTAPEGGEEITSETVLGFTADTTLYARWSQAFCMISFDGNGADTGTMDTKKMAHGDKYKLPYCSFYKQGYDFAGWEIGGKVYSPNSSLVIPEEEKLLCKATWTLKQHKVELNGQVNNQTIEYTVSHGYAYTLPECSFTRVGYTFTGWGIYNYTTDTYDYYAPKDSVTVTDDTVIYAQWKPITYTVHFDTAGGEAAEDITVSYDEYFWPGQISFTRDHYSVAGFRYDGTLYAKGERFRNLADHETTVTVTVVWKYEYEGSGIEQAPYLIPNADAFLGLPDFIGSTTLKDISFRLTADLDLGGATMTSIDGFAGHFDGNGHTVSNFTVSGNGLFAKNTGRITDLSLDQVTVIWENTSNPYASDSVGVLVGRNEGVIRHCSVDSSRITVKSIGSTVNVGGLVGELKNSFVFHSSFNGEISVFANENQQMNYVRVGGLAGSVLTTDLGCCYAVSKISVTVSEGVSVGGLLGTVDSYSVVDSAFSSFSGDITSKNVGTASDAIKVGGAMGSADDTTVKECFAAASGITLNGEPFAVREAEGVSKATAQELLSLGWMKEHLPVFTTTGWAMTDGAYPVRSDDISSTVTISTKEELMALSGKRLLGRYVLTADLDLTGENWLPATLFGVFDGNGHSITGLSFKKLVDGRGGLFAVNHGEITSLVLKDCAIELELYVSPYVGGLVGENFGRIHACHVDGNLSVTAKGLCIHLGGIAGISRDGVISDCYVTADIFAEGTNTSHLGGITTISPSEGSVLRCYTIGDFNMKTGEGFYGIARKGSACFSLAYMTGNNKYDTVHGYHTKCYGCITQNGVSYDDSNRMSPEGLMKVDFLKNTLGFEQFVSAEALSDSPNAVWIYDGSDFPILWFEA